MELDTLTKIKVEFFKTSGKYYDSFKFISETSIGSIDIIKVEIMNHPKFLTDMDYTFEVEQLDAWGKYLVKI